MSMIWEKLIDCQEKIIEKFEYHLEEYNEDGLGDYNQPENGWVNRTWNSDHIRRAHIDVVDAREQRGLWMMHVCVFPQLHNDAPIRSEEHTSQLHSLCHISYSVFSFTN